MKKTYKKPLTEVVKINAEQMICESFTLNQSNEYDSGSMIIGGKDDEEFDENFW